MAAESEKIVLDSVVNVTAITGLQESMKAAYKPMLAHSYAQAGAGPFSADRAAEAFINTFVRAIYARSTQAAAHTLAGRAAHTILGSSNQKIINGEKINVPNNPDWNPTLEDNIVQTWISRKAQESIGIIPLQQMNTRILNRQRMSARTAMFKSNMKNLESAAKFIGSDAYNNMTEDQRGAFLNNFKNNAYKLDRDFQLSRRIKSTGLSDESIDDINAKVELAEELKKNTRATGLLSKATVIAAGRFASEAYIGYMGSRNPYSAVRDKGLDAIRYGSLGLMAFGGPVGAVVGGAGLVASTVVKGDLERRKTQRAAYMEDRVASKSSATNLSLARSMERSGVMSASTLHSDSYKREEFVGNMMLGNFDEKEWQALSLMPNALAAKLAGADEATFMRAVEQDAAALPPTLRFAAMRQAGISREYYGATKTGAFEDFERNRKRYDDWDSMVRNNMEGVDRRSWNEFIGKDLRSFYDGTMSYGNTDSGVKRGVSRMLGLDSGETPLAEILTNITETLAEKVLDTNIIIDLNVNGDNEKIVADRDHDGIFRVTAGR